MRYVLILWGAPLILFWSWFFVSLNDWNFGYVMLTRDFHDLLFQLYGEIFGVDPAILPGLAARGCLIDTFILTAILAFRSRRSLAAKWRAFRDRHASAVQSSVPSA